MGKTKIECPNLPLNVSETKITKTIEKVEVKELSKPSSNSNDAKNAIVPNTVNKDFTHEWYQNHNSIFITLKSKNPFDSSKHRVVIAKRKLIIEIGENKQVVYEILLCNSISHQ